jgi:purine-binding chemotaxis protein CheW
MKIVTFRVDKEVYGIAVEIVKSIERVSQITPIPLSNESIEGVINLRGVIVTVLDLRKMLGMSLKDFTSETRFLVINNNAYIVDEAMDVLDITESQIEGYRSSDSSPIEGVLNLNNSLVIILKVSLFD